MRTNTNNNSLLEVHNFIQASKKALKSKRGRLDEAHKQIHTVVQEDTENIPDIETQQHNSTQLATALNISIYQPREVETHLFECDSSFIVQILQREHNLQLQFMLRCHLLPLFQ